MKKLIVIIILILAIFGFSSCSSDEITTYHYKKGAQIETQQAPKEFQQYEAQAKKTAIPVKTCSPPCSPPTTCNSTTGTCEGSAVKKKDGHSPSTYQYDYYALRNGRED